MLTELVTPIPGVQTNWSYVPSRPGLDIVWRRWRARRGKQAGPAWSAVVPATKQQRWLVYFVFAADGKLDAGHLFTLDRLAQEEASLMVVCACPEAHPVLQELQSRSDALYWKAITGWDYSAYAIALSELVRVSPGSDVLVLNDSVFGPFRPLVPFMDAAPWRLAGFTGNAGKENHIQSYAFMVKSIDGEVMDTLAPVMSTQWSYNAADPVILLQETLMARVAHERLGVGSYFFTDGSRYEDLCLNCPEQLIDAGFPFLKRSLLGKFAGVFHERHRMQALLRRQGHPAA
jgi:lipopolysaccharide biosynthesis protein